MRLSPFQLALTAVLALSAPLAAAEPSLAAPAPGYADLASLSDGAPLVIHIRVKDQAVVPAERAPGLAAGHARLYVEAQTMALLSGAAALPESLRYRSMFRWARRANAQVKKRNSSVAPR